MTAIKPRVCFVGNSDVDTRLELMHKLASDFDISAIGSRAALKEQFGQEGFQYRSYTSTQRVAPISDIQATYQLYRLFRELKPDLVHAFGDKPCVFARTAARLARVPVVIGTVPGLGSLYTNDEVGTRIIRAVYERLQRGASRVSELTIVQNQDDFDEFVRRRVMVASKTLVIPGSGVSTERFSRDAISREKRRKLRRDLGIRDDEHVVTMISRVIRTKGVLDFAQAAQAVREVHQDTRFLLIGADDRESRDRLTATELKEIKRSVDWPGARPSEDIPTVLATSDIFVLPSAYREGIPRVLLEAASMGLPLVTTDSPGCREVVADRKNGCLIRAGDIRALEDSIITLLDNAARRERFGAMSRELAVETFELDLIAERHREIYFRYLRKHGGEQPAPLEQEAELHQVSRSG